MGAIRSRIFTKQEREAYKYAMGKKAPAMLTREKAIKQVQGALKELEKDKRYLERQLEEEGTKLSDEEWEVSPVARAEQKITWAKRFLKDAKKMETLLRG